MKEAQHKVETLQSENVRCVKVDTVWIRKPANVSKHRVLT